MRRAGLRICKGMKRDFSRRKFLRTAVVAGAAMSTPVMLSAAVLKRSAAGKPSAIKFGLASYTFRNFSHAQLIAYMQQLGVSGLNAKDVKDHLPTDPTLESQAIA